jgi:hypothetical protein
MLGVLHQRLTTHDLHDRARARDRRPVDRRSTGSVRVLSYGTSRERAVARVQALALRVIAERLENDEAPPDLLNVTFNAA